MESPSRNNNEAKKKERKKERKKEKKEREERKKMERIGSKPRGFDLFLFSLFFPPFFFPFSWVLSNEKKLKEKVGHL